MTSLEDYLEYPDPDAIYQTTTMLKEANGHDFDPRVFSLLSASTSASMFTVKAPPSLCMSHISVGE